MQKVGDLKLKVGDKLKNLKENLLKVKIRINIHDSAILTSNRCSFQQPLQIPQMGFIDPHNVQMLVPDSYLNSRPKDGTDGANTDKGDDSVRLSDQEILESTEAIYFTENVDTGVYELKVVVLTGS